MSELEKAAGEELIHSYVCLDKEQFHYGGEAMLNMFRKGAEWQAKQSPWISVEERLPSSDNDLYIALNTKMTPPGIDVCEFDVKSKRWTDSRHVVVRPTHWMPIPKLS